MPPSSPPMDSSISRGQRRLQRRPPGPTFDLVATNEIGESPTLPAISQGRSSSAARNPSSASASAEKLRNRFSMTSGRMAPLVIRHSDFVIPQPFRIIKTPPPRSVVPTNPTSPPMLLEIRNLTKSYRALDGGDPSKSSAASNLRSPLAKAWPSRAFRLRQEHRLEHHWRPRPRGLR